MSSVFSNIINNVLRYGNGDFSVSMNENCEIRFTNSAPLLSETQVLKLFDRFYTVENAKGSTGIGLSIARTLVEKMNGKIKASYKEGKLTIGIIFEKVERQK